MRTSSGPHSRTAAGRRCPTAVPALPPARARRTGIRGPPGSLRGQALTAQARGHPCPSSERPGQVVDRLSDGACLVAHRLPESLRDRLASPRGAQPPHEIRQPALGMPEAGTGPTTVSAAGKLLRLLDVLQSVSLQRCEQAGAERRGRDVLLDLRREDAQAALDRREGRRRAADGSVVVEVIEVRSRSSRLRSRCWTFRSRRCH